MKTEELIVHLARDAKPVTPLANPFARLAGWTLIAMVLAAVGIGVIGPRSDLTAAVGNFEFLALASVTLLTAVLAAAAAFASSVPGAERSAALRAMPFAAASAWVIGLIVLLVQDGNAPARLLALPIHAACIIEIAAFGLLPGWMLVSMLRRAAPLQPAWSAALAALAAMALGAAATQIVCPVDDPAHHLAGHAAPMMLLAAAGARTARESLDWLPRRGAQ